ncbi:hypothetical protein M002_30070 [Pseudomonas aeruginosa ID4365]|nr:hypothetical protein M002_30070 [Pseudomonas aeruginosa ID4365]
MGLLTLYCGLSFMLLVKKASGLAKDDRSSIFWFPWEALIKII